MDADKLFRVSVGPLWPAGGQYIGILLGPERTRECFFLGKNLQVGDRRSYRGGWEHPLAGVCMRFSVCVLFENCTVDASIFVVSN